jgi:hypothetical protein
VRSGGFGHLLGHGFFDHGFFDQGLFDHGFFAVVRLRASGRQHQTRDEKTALSCSGTHGTSSWLAQLTEKVSGTWPRVNRRKGHRLTGPDRDTVT